MKQFFVDLTERAIKTLFQSLAGSLVGVAAFEAIEWKHALMIAAIATIVSVCTSMGSFRFGDKGTACVVKINYEEDSDDE